MHHLTPFIAAKLGCTATQTLVRAEVEKERLRCLRQAKKIRTVKSGAETLYEKVKMKALARAFEDQADDLLVAQFDIEDEVLALCATPKDA